MSSEVIILLLACSMTSTLKGNLENAVKNTALQNTYHYAVCCTEAPAQIQHSSLFSYTEVE